MMKIAVWYFYPQIDPGMARSRTRSTNVPRNGGDK